MNRPTFNVKKITDISLSYDTDTVIVMNSSVYHFKVSPITNWYIMIISKHAVCSYLWSETPTDVQTFCFWIEPLVNQNFSIPTCLTEILKKATEPTWTKVCSSTPHVPQSCVWRLGDSAMTPDRCLFSLCRLLTRSPSQNSSGNTGGRGCPCTSNTSLHNIKHHCDGVKETRHFSPNIHITPMAKLPMLKPSAWPGNPEWGRHRDTLESKWRPQVRTCQTLLNF